MVHEQCALVQPPPAALQLVSARSHSHLRTPGSNQCIFALQVIGLTQTWSNEVTGTIELTTSLSCSQPSTFTPSCTLLRSKGTFAAYLSYLHPSQRCFLQRQPDGVPGLHNGHTISAGRTQGIQDAQQLIYDVTVLTPPRAGSTSTVGDIPCGNSYSEALLFKNNTQHSLTPSHSLPITSQQPTSGMSHSVSPAQLAKSAWLPG